MANPRKFSEKIALHHQKQAEETAAFEKIMREVSDATSKVNSGTRAITKSQNTESSNDSTLRPNQAGLGTFRSGSLPNVTAQELEAIDTEQQKPEEVGLPGYCLGGARSGGTSPSRAPGPRGRASSSVGPMRARPAERKHDTSPYGSSIYLSPPPDVSWRRTNSDSALHQSSGDQQLAQPHAQLSAAAALHNHQRRTTDSNIDSMLALLHSGQPRPRSSCEVPRVPGIKVYESGGGGGGGGGGLTAAELQMPGGSLPDLTALHYPLASHPSHPAHPAHPSHPSQPHPGYVHRTPSPTPPHYHQPDHTLPLPHRTSPEHLYHHHHSPSSASPGALSPAAGGSPVSPPHSHAHHQDPPSHSHPHHHPPYEAQNHLSVPNSNSFRLHRDKSMSPLDQSWMSNYQHCSPPSLHSSHSNINVPSPTMAQSPGSPGGESPQPDSYYINQALLQPFQQITMMDSPVTSYSQTYMNHASPQTTNCHQPQSTYTQAGQRVGGGAHCDGRQRSQGDPTLFPALASPTTTPPSIPDIILTDFSGELSMTKEMLGWTGCEEERLREDLEPVDLDELHLLADNDPSCLLPDPSAEDVFRLDRL